MNLKHLGDALDHWKGSVISLFAGPELRIVPMLTDADSWTAGHFRVYARLLGRKTKDILKRGVPFSNITRHKYFSNLGERDLFLDPDTGVKNKPSEKHITPADIARLLPPSCSRMLLVYQHASRKKDGVKAKLQWLRSLEGFERLHVIAYDAGPVSMIFISRHRGRSDKVWTRLRSSLGPIASARLL